MPITDTSDAAAAGVVPPQVRPADFAVCYEHRSAPLPPPHSTQQTIWIGPGHEGVIEMVPGERSPSVPVWIERFALSDAHLDWLFQTLTDHGVFAGGWVARNDSPIGSGTDRLSIVAGGHTIVVPAFVTPDREAPAAAMVGATRALVPQPTWDNLNIKRAAYVAQYATGPGIPRQAQIFPQTGRPLFDPLAIFVAGFLGGPIGGAVPLAMNFSRLGTPGPAALLSIAGGLAATVILIMLPVTKELRLGAGVAAAVVLRALAQQLQGSAIEAARQRGNPLASRWMAAGIGLIFLAVQFVAVYLALGAGILSAPE